MEHICRASTTSKLSSELSISQTDESINGAELSLYLSNPCKPEEASPKTSKGFLAIQYISHSTAWKLRHHNHHVFLIVPPYSHYSCSTNNSEKRQSDTLIQRVDSCGVRAWKHNRAAPRFWSAPVGSIASKIFFFFPGIQLLFIWSQFKNSNPYEHIWANQKIKSVLFCTWLKEFWYPQSLEERVLFWSILTCQNPKMEE